MDNLGTEVGQKMRGAVKAKLIELGTGGTGGYIDDELPDYVMIMVANKRSKKQMRDDLKLFLNDNTDTFVNWLHQVLDKLQAVTLPPSVVQKVTNSKNAEGKKEKRSKKQKRISKEQSPEPQASITDVFADHLIGKVKKSLEGESQVTVKKPPEGRKEVSSVMEMATNVVVSSKKKELEELAVIQKQIDEAKRQLKIIPAAPETPPPPQDGGEKTAEDDDDDFLNLKADDEDDVDNDSQKDDTTAVVEREGHRKHRNRSPIVFDHSHSTRRSSKEAPDAAAVAAAKPKASARDRLGEKGEHIISLSAHRQMERELYTPVHRREPPSTIADRPRAGRLPEPPREPRRSRDAVPPRDRHQVHRRSPQRRERRSRERRPLSRSRERPFRPVSGSRLEGRRVDRSTSPVVVAFEREPAGAMEAEPQAVVLVPPRLSVRQRVGSRVIVAPPKPPQPEEQPIDVPVNSVVTIKPRPAVPKNRQANKNLLLRAVAEAQKSIAGTMTRPLEAPTQRLGPKPGGPEKSLKSRLGVRKRLEGSGSAEVAAEPAKRAKTEKIIIEIGPNDGESDNEDIGLMDDDDEEDKREPIRSDCVPKVNKEGLEQANNGVDREIMPKEAAVAVVVGDSTQFVVTLDGAFKKQSNTKVRSRLNKAVAEKKILDNITRDDVAPAKQATKRAAPAALRPTSDEPIRDSGRQRSREGKVPDLRLRVEEKRKGSPAMAAVVIESKSQRSPIKFRERQEGTGSSKPDSGNHRDASAPPIRKRIRLSDSPRSDHDNGEQEPKSAVVVIDGREKEKRDPKKYDNIPPLLSSVAVTAVGSTIGKVLERCKFYPNCSRGAESCEFVHPSTVCKTFPNCKFGEKCLYIHPRCKFDLACTRLDCNYSHTPVSSSAAPLSSHVIPVQNYKSIQPKPLPPLCKFNMNCSNPQCTFYHPIMCRFGNQCINKIECNYYHRDLPNPDNKFKWISPMSG